MRSALTRWVPASMLLVTAWYVGCASVPDIRFVGDGAEGGTDASVTIDASIDGVSSDGSAGGDAPACAMASPGAGATCCGHVWCVGDCSPSNCDLCANKGCQTGELCCGKNGNVGCKTRCP